VKLSQIKGENRNIFIVSMLNVSFDDAHHIRVETADSQLSYGKLKLSQRSCV